MRSFAEIAQGKTREELKSYWNDVFSFCGSALYVETLPAGEEYRPLPGESFAAEARPKRITWVNRERVPGWLQVEVMKNWHEFVALFDESLEALEPLEESGS